MPSVVFDVVGTCFSYDAGAEALEARLGDKLKAHGIPSKLLMYAWITAGERDYSYLSVIKEYKIFIDIMSQSFIRLLYQAGVPDPANFATKEDVDFVISEYKKLKPRPGLSEMMNTLRTNGFEVWCCSDANVDRVKGYFDGAEVEMPMDHILSADMVKAGKPEPKVYKMAREKARADEPGEVSIFAASHAWDVAAARSAGFHTAYCTVYEFDPCEGLYGKMDIIEPTLIDMGNAIVAKYGRKG